MRIAIIIPARYASSRFPAKPLHPIAGQSLIQRTWNIANACEDADEVVVATDHKLIYDHVEEVVGGRAMMTLATWENGSERVLEAASALNPVPDVVVNLQGDSPLTPPWVLSELCKHMRQSPETQVATPAVRVSEDVFQKLSKASLSGKAGGTFVVRDRTGKALYFSKSAIPFIRNRAESLPLMKHLGIYAYRLEMLKRYVSLEMGELERIEGLEQLRLLEHGIPVQVLEVCFRGREAWSVDTPEDARQVEQIIERQGELV